MAKKSSNGGGLTGTLISCGLFVLIALRLLGYNIEDKINYNVTYYTKVAIQKTKELVGLVPQNNTVKVDTSRYLSIAKDWNFKDLPNYYRVVGKANIDEQTFPEKGKIIYGNKDALGRTTTAKGNLTYDNVKGSYGKRPPILDSQNPSGWIGNATKIDQKTGKKIVVTYPIVSSDGRIYNGVFWNASHLIADRLGGEPIRENLITGTRTQNVGGVDQKGGMKYIESKATDYLESNHDKSLYYEAIPIYDGNELVPRGVLVNAKSSDGKIDESVMTYNVANGYEINYQEGTFKAVENK